MERSKVSIEIVGYASIAKASRMGPVRGYVNGRLCTLLVYDADLDLISETRLASFMGQLQHKSLSVFLGNDMVRSEETQKDYNVYSFQGSEQSLLDFKSRNRSFGLTVSVVKQILESVTHVHSKGFVVEGLVRPSTFLFSQDEDGVTVKLQPFRCLSLKSDFVGRHSKASNILDLVTLFRQFFFTLEGSNEPVIRHVPVFGGKTAYEEEVVNFIRKLLKLGLSFSQVSNIKFSPLKNIKNDPLFWDWETRLLFLQCAWEWCSGLAKDHIVINSINAMPDFLSYVGPEWSNLHAGVNKDLREVRYPSRNGTTCIIPGPPASSVDRPPASVNSPPAPPASANSQQSCRASANSQQSSRTSANSQQSSRASANSQQSSRASANKQQSSRASANSQQSSRASSNSQQSSRAYVMIPPAPASASANNLRGRASENSPPSSASANRQQSRAYVHSPPAPTASANNPEGRASVKRGRASENSPPAPPASVKRGRASDNRAPAPASHVIIPPAPPASVNTQPGPSAGNHTRRGFRMKRASRKKNRSRVKRGAVAAGSAQKQNWLVPEPYSAIEFLQKMRNFVVHAPFSPDQVHGIDVYSQFDVDVRRGFDLFLATEMPKYFIGVYEILANAWDDGLCNKNLECFLDPSYDRDSIQRLL